MQVISREQLKLLLEKQPDCSLLMAMDREHYLLAHIPGSQPIEAWAAKQPPPERSEPVIVYSTNNVNHCCFHAARLLEWMGFTQVTMYPGGLEDWSEAGEPLAGALFSK